MMYKVGDEVLIKARIRDIRWAEMMYVCELVTNPDVCIRFKSPSECIVADKTYADGLKDAWELAKKLESMPLEELKKVFGVCGFYSVVKQYKIEEALAKIEAYEMEKEIKVNDIVKVKGENGFGIVTAVCATGIVYVLWNDGGCGDYEPCELETTGRTIKGLKQLLQQIKE